MASLHVEAPTKTCRYRCGSGSPCSNPVTRPDIHLCDEHARRVTELDGAVYTVVTDHFKQDLREFYARSNFYLVAQAALLAAFFGRRSPEPYANVMLVAIGLVTALFWLCVTHSTVFWIRRWREQVLRVSRELDRRFDAYAQAESPHRHLRAVRESPEDMTKWLPAVFVAAWVAILVFAFFGQGMPSSLPPASPVY